MTEIKPCPICGSEADVRICTSEYKGLGSAVVECPECGAHSRAFPCVLADNESINKAREKTINWWNETYGGWHN